MFMPWMTQFINHGHLNLYAFLYDQYGEVVMHRPGVWAPYPYGFYGLTAAWLAFLQNLSLIDLSGWNSPWQVAHPAAAVFLFKTAYLPFDLAIAYVLHSVSGRKGLALWAWSPAAVYTPFMMGQNDIYATAFAVMGTFAAAKSMGASRSDYERDRRIRPADRWRAVASIFLGIGATFKTYPLLLLLPTVLVMEANWWKRVIYLLLGSSVFLVAALPFLSTPTFVDGVLFNREGIRIFNEVELSGRSVSPFVSTYVLINIGVLMLARRESSQIWLATIVTLTSLFFWVSTPFYWLIWITPFLIAATRWQPKLGLAWFVLQVAFALQILTEHRELGAALPIHLSAWFNIPNLPTSLAIAHPNQFQAVVATLLPFINALLVASFVLALWHASRAMLEYRTRNAATQKLVRLSWLPTAIMFLGLGTNLYIGRNLVGYNNWYDWQQLTLKGDETATQRIEVKAGHITGMRLRLTEAPPSTILTLCTYSDNEAMQTPLACVSQPISRSVENRVLYFMFSESLPLASSGELIIELSVEGPDAMVRLPYAEIESDTNRATLFFDDQQLSGTLDVSPLTSFQAGVALKELIVENILQDERLLLIFAAIALSTMLFLAKLIDDTSS
ncbi:MAG: hypothetical protein RRC07_09210 [Anaerolineae bacterium]|nr:hypothetical protein [Anaerolineae bacterium]